MRTWLSSILLVVTGAFAVASGCGNPEVVDHDSLFTPDASVAGNGSGATGGSFSLGNGGDSNVCPSTCAELNANCGFVTDTKCGGTIQCGQCAPGTGVCGGDGPSRCGTGTSTVDAGPCVSSTCDELGANCGFVTDPKCGGVIQCGDCGPGESCGLGGPSICGAGDGGTCTPTVTCATLKYTCGEAADDCGNKLNCGPTTCPIAGEICSQGVCTQPPACVPTTTCAGRTCGQVGDGCGNPLTCGPSVCPNPNQTCGVSGVCTCATGACTQIPTCAAGVTTTLTGKVYDPAGRNPLYKVLVYIANDPTDPALKTFAPGITCDVCGSTAAGSPLISTPGATDPPAGEYTGVDGSFTLKNVPAGNVTLVIQLGRWRRTFPINVSKPCAANSILDKSLLMPATQAEGNIPLMAMVTGSVDSLECVLRKMGIDKSEFTDPAAGGRVQFYAGSGSAGQTIDAATPTQDKLFVTNNGVPLINSYDMTILSCQGAAYPNLTDPNQGALRAYADSGGRVFATHYSYTWLDNNHPTPSTPNVTDNWNEVAQWHVDENDRSATDTAASPITGFIDKVTNPEAGTLGPPPTGFEGWLAAVGALNATPADSTTVYVVRHDTDFISTVPGRTQQWLYRNGDNARRCATTGTTCSATAACTPKVCSVATTVACNVNGDCAARVCSNRPGTTCAVNGDCNFGNGDRGNCNANTCKDNSCTGTDYTGEETPLHFTFNTPVNLKQDLANGVVQCGRVLFSDFHVSNAAENGETFPQECGKNVSRVTGNAAGSCTTDAQCTGTCTAGKCPWGTACTTTADCASSCSGGICLDPMNPQEKLLEFMIFDLDSCVPPAKTCMKVTCPAGTCGSVPDGCGGLATCAACPTGESCGVGQPPVAGKCGSVTCNKVKCPSTQECGFASDGCSGIVSCGDCPAGQTCNNGKCGSSSCTPQSCTDQSIECGKAGDQCGNQIDCPACPADESCIAGKCVPLGCPPQTCADQGIQCGSAADGCGNVIASCGECSAGDLCVSGQCVHVN